MDFSTDPWGLCLNIDKEVVPEACGIVQSFWVEEIVAGLLGKGRPERCEDLGDRCYVLRALSREFGVPEELLGAADVWGAASR